MKMRNLNCPKCGKGISFEGCGEEWFFVCVECGLQIHTVSDFDVKNQNKSKPKTHAKDKKQTKRT